MKLNYIYYLSFYLLLVSCNNSLDRESSQTVFKYNEAAGVSSLDPAFSKDLSNIWVCNQLFNGLVQLDENLEIKPSIAKKWTVSENGKIYTFNLRNDVYFHDSEIFERAEGRRVVAADFEYSLKRVLSTEIASPGKWVFNKVKFVSNEPQIIALNDSVFQIELIEAFPPFLGLLCMKYCSVIPYEAIDIMGVDFRKHPIGTGPFKFKYWKEGSKLILLKNPKYFEFENNQRLPYLDAISISFLIDKQAAFLQFLQGKLDFLSGIDASYKDELLTQEGKLNPKFENNFNLETEAYLNLEYLGILLDDDMEIVQSHPLRNKLIRKAINYAFDRKKMMKYLRNNIGEPALSGVIPKGLAGYSESGIGYSYNPDKARALMKEAGYENGVGLNEITIATNAEYLDLCRYIQYQLNEIGFNIKIDVNPPAALRELKAQAKLNFFRASWIADYPDAENYLAMFYSKNFCPDGPNYTHFKNKRFDELYESALKENKIEKRVKLYKKMDSIVMSESVIIPLYYDQVLRFSSKKISGLGTNAINLLDLRRVKKTNLYE